MNSSKYVIIQTVLRPMHLVSIEGTDFHATEVTDFKEFFAAIGQISITADTKILVNRGPGSYSGIRTGIAYVYGLLHGGLISNKQIHSYTSFDFVRAATGHTTSIFLKAWPRVASGKLEGSKGYYENKNLENKELKTQFYKSWEEIAEEKELLIVSDEAIKTTHEFRTYAELIKDPVGYRELTSMIEQLDNTLDPLYINPVHIS